MPLPESQPKSATHTSRDLPPPASSSQLPRVQTRRKREAAVKLERNVKPRQLRSFREKVQEHVNDHGAEGIGAHAVFSSAVNCQKTESRSEGDGHLRRVSDEQRVELSLDTSWKDLVTFATKPHSSRNLIASNGPQE